MIVVDFKEWMDILEGSFTDADVPAHFYVGCYFSDDFFKPKTYTPEGAAATLVGLEGLSESAGTAFGFWHGAGVKMPGKEVVALNKISRMMYTNPEYLASMGFRGPRRTDTGSGGPTSTGGSGRISQDSIIRSRLESVISSILSAYPDMGDGSYSTIKLKDGTVWNLDDMVRELKKIKPHTGVFGGHAREVKTPPGSIQQGKKKKSRKPIRNPHLEDDNNFKNWRSATDMASRIYILLRGYKGRPGVKDPQRLIGQTGICKDCHARWHDPKHTQCPKCNSTNIQQAETPQIIKWTKDASGATGWHSGEQEWIMGRRPLGPMGGVQCPHCRRDVAIPEDFKKGDINVCKNCNEEWPADSTKSGPQTCPKCASSDVQTAHAHFPCPNCSKEIAVGTMMPMHTLHKTGKKCQSCGAFIMIPNHIRRGKWDACQDCQNEWKHLDGQNECPNCHSTNIVHGDNAKFQCPKCSNPIEVDDKANRTASRPMLHIPIGSQLFVQNSQTDTVYQWYEPHIKKIEKEWGKTIPKSEYVKSLIEYYGMANRFEIHMVYDSSDAQTKAKKADLRSHDPQRLDTENKIKELLKKGVNRIPLLQKLLERRDKIPAVKTKNILGRWANIGIIEIDNDRVKLINGDYSEDMLLVYKYIKSNEGVDKSDITSETGVDGTDLDTALDELLKRDRIQILSNGNYDIKLSDQEMQQISPLEQDILDVIDKGSYSDYYSLKSVLKVSKDSKEIKAALRLLTLKGKIFQGSISGVWMLTIPPGKPLDPMEQKIFDHLKDYPVSDRESITDELPNENYDNVTKAIEGLLARKMITVENSGDTIKLNTTNHQPNANHKPYPKSVEKLMKVLADHFLTTRSEVASLMKQDPYDMENKLYSLRNKGLIDLVENRYVPKDGSAKPPEETEEAKWIIEQLKTEMKTAEELADGLDTLNGSYTTKTTDRLLRKMDGKFVKGTMDPVKNEMYWHDVNKTYEPDITELRKEFLEILKNAHSALSEDYVTSKFNNNSSDYISDEGSLHVLQRMQKEGLVEGPQEDWTGRQVWWLKGSDNAPKPKEWWEKVVEKILKDKGPQTMDSIVRLLYDEHDFPDPWSRTLVEEMDGKSIRSEHHVFAQEDMYMLPDQKLTSEDVYNQAIMKVLKEKGPKTPYDISTELNGEGLHCTGDGLADLLYKMKDDEHTINSSTNMQGNTLYHLPDQNPMESEYKRVEEFLKQKGGFAKARAIYKYYYNDLYIGTTSSIKKLVEDMISKGKLHVVADAGEFWMKVVSLDPNTQVDTLEQGIVKMVQAAGDAGIAATKLWEKFRDEVNEDSYTLKNELEKMVTDGKIFKQGVSANYSSDYWSYTKFFAKEPDYSQAEQKIIDAIKAGTPDGVSASDIFHSAFGGDNAGFVNWLFEKMVTEGKIHRVGGSKFDWYSLYKVGPKSAEDMKKELGVAAVDNAAEFAIQAIKDHGSPLSTGGKKMNVGNMIMWMTNDKHGESPLDVDGAKAHLEKLLDATPLAQQGKLTKKKDSYYGSMYTLSADAIAPPTPTPVPTPAPAGTSPGSVW